MIYFEDILEKKPELLYSSITHRKKTQTKNIASLPYLTASVSVYLFQLLGTAREPGSWRHLTKGFPFLLIISSPCPPSRLMFGVHSSKAETNPKNSNYLPFQKITGPYVYPEDFCTDVFAKPEEHNFCFS